MSRICHFGSKSVLLRAFLFCVLVSYITAVGVPVSVIRRVTGDIYYVTSSNYFICHDDDVTFLVSERRCVRNQELFNGNTSNYLQ